MILPYLSLHGIYIHSLLTTFWATSSFLCYKLTHHDHECRWFALFQIREPQWQEVLSLSSSENHKQRVKCRPRHTGSSLPFSWLPKEVLYLPWWQMNYAENVHEFQETKGQKRSQSLHKPTNLQKERLNSSEEPRTTPGSYLSPAAVRWHQPEISPWSSARWPCITLPIQPMLAGFSAH